MVANQDLYTVVKNTSGSPMFFGYLGRLGKYLQVNETYAIYGTFQALWKWDEMKQASLEAALSQGLLTILSTPKPIAYDASPPGGLADPTTAATVSPTGGGSTGGSLPAGNYQVEYTFYNTVGETLPGGESATFTVAAGNQPQVTTPAIPAGATGVNVYLTNVNAPGVFAYYGHFTSGTTYTLTSASWTDATTTFANAAAPPTTNTSSGLANPTTAVTISVTGGGSTAGALAAGTYQAAYTFTNQWGETLAGGRSTTFTVVAGDKPQATTPAFPTGATGLNLYLTNVNTPTGALALYAGITSGTTVDLYNALYDNDQTTFADSPAPPTANTTLGHTVRAIGVYDDAFLASDPSWGAATAVETAIVE